MLNPFLPPAESWCSISAEHLPQSELKPAGGCNWTSGSWKGQLPAYVIRFRRWFPVSDSGISNYGVIQLDCLRFSLKCQLILYLFMCLHVLPVITFELHPGRATPWKGGAEGQRSADLCRPAALGVPWNHPQQHPVWERDESTDVWESHQSLCSKEGESSLIIT